MRKLISICCLLFLTQADVHAQIDAEVKFNFRRGSYKGSYYDVIVSKNGEQFNLTRFKPWEEILRVEISPDSNYLFVRHKPQKGGPYLLSLYDLRTLRLIRRIAPGTGGDFEWDNNNQIIHQWGCGTNCANVRVYDLRLKPIFFTLSSGGFLLSPDKRYVVQFSVHEDQMWVYDLKSVKNGVHPRTYHSAIDTVYSVWNLNEKLDVRFTGNHTIRFVRKDGTKGKELIIHLDRVKWKRVNPEKIGEFYLRSF